MYLEDVVVNNPDDFVHDKDGPIKRPVLTIHSKIIVMPRLVPLSLELNQQTNITKQLDLSDNYTLSARSATKH